MKTEYEDFLEATVDLTCARAHEFSNRANARIALGRQDEALRDYDKACSLDRDDTSFLVNRSGLLLELGMRERAVEDLRKARQLSGNGDVAKPRELFYIAQVFVLRNETDLAEETLLAFLQLVLSIMPYTTAMADVHGYVIRKVIPCISAPILDFDDLDHFIHVLSEVKSGQGIREIKRLSNQTRREILCTSRDTHQESQ